MNYSLTTLPKSEIEISVTVPFSEFEPFLSKAAIAISENVEIKGFRKGKAPYDMIEKAVGKMAIYNEAAELAVRATYPEALRKLIQEGKVTTSNPPIGRPEISVTQLEPEKELLYKAKTAILPSIELPDYKTIAKKTRGEKQNVEVTDEEIQKTIDWVRESRATTITVARAAALGDVVEIDFETRADGVRIEGGDAKKHTFVLGKGKFLPGFEDAIVGMNTGEKKDFSLNVPDDWREKNFAGKKLDCTVHVNLVQERKLPELTEEFVRGLGDFTSIETLTQNIKDGLLQEKTEKEKQRVQALIIEKIADASKTEVPEVLIERELDKMLDEFKGGIEEMGMVWADYLLHLKKSLEELRKDWNKEAERRVKIALTLNAIGTQEHIEPTEEEVKTAANQYLARYKSAKAAEKEIDPQALRDYTKGVLRNQKVFAYLETV